MASDAAHRLDPEILLSNAAWVRALALRLVRDEFGADDVVQDTLVAAIERPPLEHVPLRPWLARVAKNFSLRSLRDRRRRLRREAARLVPPPQPSVEESAARTEMFHAVVGAVLELEPLYRDVVVLRFFEGLDMPAAAQRLGVPVETARTRLKRAIAMLRQRLDRTFGDRQAWALVLLPLADSPSGAAAAVAAPATTSSIGGALMAASAKPVIIAGLTGVVLGAVVTLGVGSRTAAVPPADPSHPAAANARPKGSDLDVAPRRLNGSSPQASLAVPTEEGDLKLPASSHRAITGHVVTKDGKAVAGAVVRAWPSRETPVRRRRGVVPEVPTVEQEIRAAALYAKWRAATLHETKTDAAGAYSLEDVADASHEIGAWAEGYDIRPGRHVDTYLVRPGATVDFVATSVRSVAVSVLLPDGAAPETATVHWTDPDRGGGSASPWTKADPTIQLDSGSWSLYATIGKEMKSPLVALPEEATSSITLQLVTRNAVEGSVRFDSADNDWQLVFVRARRRDAIASDDRLRVDTRPPEWSFRFEDLPPGDYEVSAELTEGAPLVTATVRVEGGTATQQLVIPRLTSTQVLEARVVGPDGRPLAEKDVSFGISERTATSTTAVGARSTQRKDGSFLIALSTPSVVARGRSSQVPPAVSPATSWFIQVRSKQHGTQEVEFTPGSTPRIDARFN